MGLGERRSGRGLQGVVGGLDRAEEGFAVHRDGEGRADRVRLGRTAGGEADADSFGGERGEPGVQFLVAEYGAVGGHRVDLVEVEPVSEQVAGLGALAQIRGEGVVLDLVRLGVDAPVGGVGVAPLAADDDVADLGPGGQPVSEELLGAAVGAGGVEVPDALRVGRVQKLVRPGAHRLDGPLAGQVALAVEVDVAGPADRCQAEPDVGGRSGRCGQSGERHRGLLVVGRNLAYPQRSPRCASHY